MACRWFHLRVLPLILVLFSIAAIAEAQNAPPIAVASVDGSYEVRADGELLTCEPANELPLAQRYFLF